MMPQILVAAGTAIILLLGFLHLAYTFFTRKFNPRDHELERDMGQVSPRISSQTTMWKAWIGINASHSLEASSCLGQFTGTCRCSHGLCWSIRYFSSDWGSPSSYRTCCSRSCTGSGPR